MEAGLIDVIPNNYLFKPKEITHYPSEYFKIIKLLSFKNTKNKILNETEIFGSYSYRLSKYSGDIDLISNIIYDLPKDEAIKQAVKDFQNVIKKVLNNRKAFFTDSKVGIYKDGESQHWTSNEILRGYRGNKRDFNNHSPEKKNIFDALSDNSLLKIDIIYPYYGRYIECTNVYDLNYIYNNKVVSIGKSETNIIKGLLVDIKKQLKKRKYFKAIKRIFSISRLIRDKKTANLLKPLLLSNLSQLYLFSSDLSSLKLLFEQGHKVNKLLVISELYNIFDRLTNILDLNIDINYIHDILSDVIDGINSKNNKNVISYIGELLEYFSSIIEEETINYLHSIGINQFEDFGKNYYS